MTSTVQGTGGDRTIVISCDKEGCTLRPTSEEIAEGGGLSEMGWAARFNDTIRTLEHFCPEHKEGTTDGE